MIASPVTVMRCDGVDSLLGDACKSSVGISLPCWGMNEEGVLTMALQLNPGWKSGRAGDRRVVLCPTCVNKELNRQDREKAAREKREAEMKKAA